MYVHNFLKTYVYRDGETPYQHFWARSLKMTGFMRRNKDIETCHRAIYSL